jgi:hypothetical protein
VGAPGRATYVEIMAVTAGAIEDGGGKPLRYRFYPGANMTNDFNIVPNFHYTLPIIFHTAGAEQDSRVENLGQVQLAESNSYIINPLAGAVQTTYGVPVFRINKFWDSVDGAAANVLAADTEWEAEVIWQDKAGEGLINFCESSGTVIDAGKYAGTGENNFYFSPKDQNAAGNVLIGVKKKGATEYLWSWHVWLTGYNPDITPSSWQENVYSYPVTGGAVHRYTGSVWSTNYTNKFIMDRNLGAVSAARQDSLVNTRGLYYQFGRKDPFPASSVLLYDGTGGALPRYHSNGDCISRVAGATAIKTAVQRPNLFYQPGETDWVQSNPYTNHPWNNPAWHDSETGKSLFDPCPPGWMLPVTGTWNGFSSGGINAANYPGDYQLNGVKAGWEFYMGGVGIGETAFYPAAGYRRHDTGTVRYGMDSGFYWAFTPHDNPLMGRNMYFYVGTVFAAATDFRSKGYTVRCIQE